MAPTAPSTAGQHNVYTKYLCKQRFAVYMANTIIIESDEGIYVEDSWKEAAKLMADWLEIQVYER